MKIYLNAPRIKCICGNRTDKSLLVKFIYAREEHTGCDNCLRTCNYCDKIAYSRYLRKTINGSKDCQACGNRACKEHYKRCSSCKKCYCIGCDIITVDMHTLTFLDLKGTKLLCRRCYLDLSYRNNELKDKAAQEKKTKTLSDLSPHVYNPWDNQLTAGTTYPDVDTTND